MRPLVIIIFLSLFVYSCGSSRRSAPSPRPPAETTVSYRIHEVKQGETFTSIAQKNNVTAQQIRSANPGVREPLKAGQKIRIPLDPKTPDESATVPDTVQPVIKPGDLKAGHKEKYKIVLMLPFKAQSFDDYSAEIDATTSRILEFYEGALIAFDSLQSLGLKAEVHVIDTEQDENLLKKFLSTDLARDADLIIGPAYSSKISLVEDFSRNNKKYIVSPISSTPDITKNNQWASQFTPSVPTQIDLASKYIADNFRDVNVVIVHKDLMIDNDLKNMYVNSLKKHNILDVYSIIFSGNSEEEIRNRLQNGRPNFVVIPSSNEAFVAEVFSTIINFGADFNLSVMGLPTWEAFETIEFGKLGNINTYFFSTSNINYENYNTREVRKKFINRWKTDPSSLGFQGYDVAFIFGKALMTYGMNFQDHLHDIRYQPTQNGINWKRTGEDGGVENQYVSIMRYKDFELRKLNK